MSLKKIKGLINTYDNYNYYGKGIEIGIEGLDHVLESMPDSGLLSIYSPTAMGKTALALNICHALLSASNNHILYISSDMNRLDILRTMVSIHTQIPLTKIKRNKLDSQDKDELNDITKSYDDLYNSDFYIDDSFNDITDLKMIEEDILKVNNDVDEYGKLYIVIDEITKKEDSFLRDLLFMARKHDAVVIALCRMDFDVCFQLSTLTKEDQVNIKNIIKIMNGYNHSYMISDISLFLYRRNYFSPNAEKDNIVSLFTINGGIYSKASNPEKIIFNGDTQTYTSYEEE